jgi:hypothetical protein
MIMTVTPTAMLDSRCVPPVRTWISECAIMALPPIPPSSPTYHRAPPGCQEGARRCEALPPKKDPIETPIEFKDPLEARRAAPRRLWATPTRSP